LPLCVIDKYFIVVFLLLQEDTSNKNADSSVDYKDSQKFSDHMQSKNEAVSKFATEKTIAQQRAYLPIFAIRQEVCISNNL
jgi:pre-mRNA-splicing factor ATP-dependent RNA helicase DHX38/PRP16